MKAVALLCSLLFCICYLDSAFGAKQKQEPRTGWCLTKHKPPKAAQSGYEGYCKTCYKEKFPEKHAAKLQRRNKPCPCCGQCLDLRANGYCKSCITSRSCARCGDVSHDQSAVACSSCSVLREQLGATQQRLALWCGSCYSMEECMSGVCGSCYETMFKDSCEHCGIDG